MTALELAGSYSGKGKLTSAGVLEVVGGKIVRGELIYDAEGLRRAMTEAQA